MEQLYQCVHCGAENEVDLDLGNGDRQRLVSECNGCGRANVIQAMYNYHASEFDLKVEPDSSEQS